MSKEISVVIPNFNGEAFLENCLNSLEEQSFKDFEIIIVDDCSTDDSLTILKNHPRICRGRKREEPDRCG